MDDRTLWYLTITGALLSFRWLLIHGETPHVIVLRALCLVAIFDIAAFRLRLFGKAANEREALARLWDGLHRRDRRGR